MRAGLLVGGVIVVLLGWSLTLTLIGALIGLPFILIGGIMILVGLFSSGRKTEQIIVSQQVGHSEPIQRIHVRCLKCSTLNSEDARYCSKCGAELRK
jgi:hypothetical protein